MNVTSGEQAHHTQASSAPMLSVCIPSFNAEHSIAQCLEAVLAQNLNQCEIVLVDNCSTDRTIEIATALLAETPNARIVSNASNIGRVPNWNRCIELARGEFLKFAFTNDALLPGALGQLLKTIHSDPEIVMVGSRMLAVERMPQVLPPVPEKFEARTMDSGAALEYFATDGFAASGSLNGMIYRRSAIVDKNLRFKVETPYFADFMFALELAACGKTVLLDVASHCFNLGAEGRHHITGMKNLSQYLAEHRVATNLHMKLLEAQGRDSRKALEYLRGRFFWYLGQNYGVTATDAMNIFGGFPRIQLEAASKTIWFQARQKLAKSG